MPSSDEPSTGQSVTRGRLLILTAAVLWGLSGFFAKAPAFAGWPGVLLAFWRAAFASLLLVPLVRRPRWSSRLVPMIASFVLMNITYLTAMTMTEAANAIWLQYTAPAWVFLLGVFFFREPVGRGDLSLFVFSTLGVGVIVVCEVSQFALAGIVYGLLSGVFFAGIVISLRQLRDFDSAWLVALNHVSAAVVLLPFVLASPQHWPAGEQWVYLAGFGMIQMGLPYALFALGLKSVSGHEASGITLLEPLLVPVWVWLSWGEVPRWWSLVGGGLILMGLLVRYVPLLRPTRTAS